MKLTADTITDEQIRELKERAVAVRDDETYDICNRALRPLDRDAARVYGDRYVVNARKARARCAEILNARQDGAK